ncbi:MAG: hypothetical protein H7Y28_00285 [Rhodoferax sp.]|nr:hypothetical protein [Rhodoferax sp.]
MVDRDRADKEVCIGSLHAVGPAGFEGLRRLFKVVLGDGNILKRREPVAQSLKLARRSDTAQQFLAYRAHQDGPWVLNQLGQTPDGGQSGGSDRKFEFSKG